MARLRVGNIRIDGSQVGSWGDPPKHHPEPPSRILAWLGRPFVRPLSAFMGVGLVGLGILSLLTGVTGADSFTPIALGLLLSLCGIGTIGIAIAQPAFKRQWDTERLRFVRPTMEQILRILDAPSPHQTVEWLTGKLRSSEAVVVAALLELRAEQQVREELDLETGMFYYGLIGNSSKSSEDLDTRSGRLKRSSDR